MAAVQAPSPVQAPAFTRLLARLAGADIPASGPALAERLGQWLDWNRAVVLARALDGRLPEPQPTATTGSDDAADCARVRASLAEAIGSERGLNLTASAAADFAPFRQYALATQRAMLAASGRLRGQLREQMAAIPALARLAEVDAVMEQTLSPREANVLAGVPRLLEARFEQLRASAGPPVAELPHAVAAGDAGALALPPAPAPWLAVFRGDLKDVLLAELDVRFHPIEGLLAALRTC